MDGTDDVSSTLQSVEGCDLQECRLESGPGTEGDRQFVKGRVHPKVSKGRKGFKWIKHKVVAGVQKLVRSRFRRKGKKSKEHNETSPFKDKRTKCWTASCLTGDNTDHPDHTKTYKQRNKKSGNIQSETDIYNVGRSSDSFQEILPLETKLFFTDDLTSSDADDFKNDHFQEWDKLSLTSLDNDQSDIEPYVSRTVEADMISLGHYEEDDEYEETLVKQVVSAPQKSAIFLSKSLTVEHIKPCSQECNAFECADNTGEYHQKRESQKSVNPSIRSETNDNDTITVSLLLKKLLNTGLGNTPVESCRQDTIHDGKGIMKVDEFKMDDPSESLNQIHSKNYQDKSHRRSAKNSAKMFSLSKPGIKEEFNFKKKLYLGKSIITNEKLTVYSSDASSVESLACCTSSSSDMILVPPDSRSTQPKSRIVDLQNSFQQKDDANIRKLDKKIQDYLDGFRDAFLYVFMIPHYRTNGASATETNGTNEVESEDRNETHGATAARLSINEAPPTTGDIYVNDFEQINAGTVTQSMRSEWARLKSFWSFPLSCPIAPTALAKHGFYYTGNEDKASCFCCGVTHGNWQKGESVYAVHYTISKTCRFMRGDDVGNIPIHGPNSTLNQRVGHEDLFVFRPAETTLTSEERELTSLLQTPDSVTSILLGRERDRGNPASLPQFIHSVPDLRETTWNRFGGASRQNDTDIRHTLRGASNLPITQTASASSSECLANNPKPITPSVFSQTLTLSTHVPDPQRTPTAPNVSTVTQSSGVSQPNDVAIQSQTDTIANQQRTPNPRQHQQQQQNQQRQGVGGADNGNLGVNTTRPRYPNYTVLTVRSSTFHGFPNHLDQTPLQMARAGFFYAGYGDCVRCFFCGGGLRNWEPGDDPWVEHARWFPRCVYVKQNKGQPFINMVHQRQQELAADNQPQCQQQRQQKGGTDSTVVNAAFPDYASLRERYKSFSDCHMYQVAWQMAKAGFFYAGFGDHVRCFFCGGDLRNWNLEDDPWVEHARCYPNCAFVKDNKGQLFINRVLRRERELTLLNEYLCTTPGVSNTTSTTSVQTAGMTDRQSNPMTDTTLETLPTATIHRHTEISVTHEDMSSSAVRTIRGMGYTEEDVIMAIQQLRRNLGSVPLSTEALVEIISGFNDDIPQEGRSQPPGQMITPASQTETVASHENTSSESIQDENNQLKEQMKCKICMDNLVCIFFLPCGHLCCCAECAPAMVKCPICRQTIRGSVRTYLS